MKKKFTPGPWEVVAGLNILKAGTKRTIANCGASHGVGKYEENIANAQLIAAAPEMYSALVLLSSLPDVIEIDDYMCAYEAIGKVYSGKEVFELVKRAIEKAEGGASNG